MAYYKRCLCGHLNIYDAPGMAPLFCEKCSRQIIQITEEKYDDKVVAEDKNKTNNRTTDKFVLVGENTGNIEFCSEIIIGRNNYGKEILVDFPDVSRDHLIIKPRPSGLAVTITDISTYGTYLNGKRINKNDPRIASVGAKIRLANRAEFVLKKGD